MPSPTQAQVENQEIRQDYVLAQHELDSLKQSLGAHDQFLGATEAGFVSGEQGSAPVLVPGLRVNRPKLNDQAKQMKKVLETCSPRPIPEKDRDKFLREAKRLEEIFKPYLETRAEIHVLKRDNPAWQSSMEKARIRMKNPAIEQAISKWKYIMRRLNPDDPDADNLHKLRTER